MSREVSVTRHRPDAPVVGVRHRSGDVTFGRRRALVVLICHVMTALIALATGAHAQPIGPTLGVVASVETSWLRSSVPVEPGSADCGVFESGRGDRVAIGVVGTIPGLLAPSFDLMLGVGWSLATRELTTTPVDSQWIYDADVDGEVLLDRQYALRLRARSFGLDVGARYHPLPWLILSLGIAASLPLIDSSAVEDRLRGPAGMTFDDGMSQRPRPAGSVLTSAPLGLDAIGGIGISLPIAARVRMLAELRGRVELLSAVRIEGVRGLGIGGSLALAYALSEQSVAPVELAEAAIDSTTMWGVSVPERRPLRVRLDAYGIDAAGMRTELTNVPVYVLTRRHIVEGESPSRSSMTEHVLETPVIRIEPEYESDVPLRRWETTLSLGDSVIARDGSSVSSDGDRGIDWGILEHGAPGDVTTIDALFSVEDSSGAHAEDRTAIRLSISEVRLVREERIGASQHRVVLVIPEAALGRRVGDSLVGALIASIDRRSRVWVGAHTSSGIAWSERARGPVEAEVRSRLAAAGLIARDGEPEHVPHLDAELEASVVVYAESDGDAE